MECQGLDLCTNVRRGIENQWKGDEDRQRGRYTETRNYISWSRFGVGNQTPNKSLQRRSNVPHRSHTPNISVRKEGFAPEIAALHRRIVLQYADARLVRLPLRKCMRHSKRSSYLVHVPLELEQMESESSSAFHDIHLH